MKAFFDKSMPIEKVFMWRRIIHVCTQSLTDKQIKFVPDIYVYTTLLKSIKNTFDEDHPGIDKICQKLFQEGTWAFAFLQSEFMRNENIDENNFKRVVIASTRHELTKDLSPELVVLHEFMHFWIYDGLKKPFNEENEDLIEDMCNRYALACYMNLIINNPHYSTHSSDRSLITIEKSIHNLLSRLDYNLNQKQRDTMFIEFAKTAWGDDNDCIRNR